MGDQGRHTHGNKILVQDGESRSKEVSEIDCTTDGNTMGWKDGDIHGKKVSDMDGTVNGNRMGNEDGVIMVATDCNHGTCKKRRHEGQH